MDVGLINAAGWKASTALEDGLKITCAEFVQQHAGRTRGIGSRRGEEPQRG
jgi:hypothetical protein